MSELKVPFAIDNNDKLHSPNYAKKGMNYFCPNCRDSLVFRNGDVNVAHFAHKTSLICSNESIEHKTAKIIVLNAINSHLRENGEKPKFLKRCGNCYKLYDIPLPDNSSLAVLEYKLPCGYIGDVVILSKDSSPLLVVEIKISHAVDNKKHNGMSTAYIELDGHEVIDNNGATPITKSKIESVYCCYGCEMERKTLNRTNKFRADRAWLAEKRRDNDLPVTNNQQPCSEASLIDIARSLAGANGIETINNDFANWNKSINAKKTKGKPAQPKAIKQQTELF